MNATANGEQAPASTAPEKIVEKVQMEDGRVVEFVGTKRKMLKDHGVTEAGAVWARFDFRNGKSVYFELPAELVLKAAGHGLEQKVGDSVAGEKEVDDMYEGVVDTTERLAKGAEGWNVQREAGGMSGFSVLLRALVELAGGRKTPEDTRAYLKTLTPKEKIALRQSAKLKPIIDRLEAEKAEKGPKVDTDALLGAFEGAAA